MRCRTCVGGDRSALRSCYLFGTRLFRSHASRFGAALMLGLVAMLATASPANAQTTSTWNNLTSSTWSTAGNWTPSGVPSGTAVTVDFSTLHMTAAITVTVATDTVNIAKFGDQDSAFAWTLTGTTLTLGGTTPTIDVNNQSATITSILAGSAGFTLNGPGTLILNNASNTITGTITINSGTLQAGLANTIGPAATPDSLSFTGGQFVTNGLAEAIGGLSGTGTVANNLQTTASTLTIGAGNSSPAAFTGVLENTFGVTTGTLGITKTGTGTLTLGGTSIYTGTTTVNNGTLTASAANAFSPFSAVSVSTSTGIVALGGFSQIIGSLTGVASSSVTNNSNTAATLTVGFDNTSPTFSGIISNTTAANTGKLSLVKIGTGTETLAAGTGTGKETYTGGTTVTGGTLIVNLAALTTPTNLINGNTALTIGSATFNVAGQASASASQGFNSGLTIAGGALSTVTVVGTSTLVDFEQITRNTGATLDISGTANAFTGTINTNGTATTLGGWATVAGTDWAVVSGTINGAGSNNIVGLSTLTGYTSDTWGSGNDVTVTLATNTTAALPANSLRFNANQASVVTLSSTSAGSPNVIASGGILVTSTVATAGSSITGGFLSSGNTTDLIVQQFSGQTFTISSAIVDNGGPIGLTKSGTGTLVVNGANTFSGQTTINAGVLSIPSDASGALASVSAPLGRSATISINGGTLLTSLPMVLNANRSINVGPVVGAGNGTIAVTGGTQTVYNGLITINAPLDGVIFGSSSGTGILYLGGQSTYGGPGIYNGPTTVAFGQIAAAATNVWSPNSAYTNTSATAGGMVLNGFSQSIGAVSGTGTLTNNSNNGATLTVGNLNLQLPATYSGVISNDITIPSTGVGLLSLTKIGTGNQILSSTGNTYSGPTTINNGSLIAGAAGILSASTTLGSFMTVNSPGAFVLNGNSEGLWGLSGSGTVTNNSNTAATLFLGSNTSSTANTYPVDFATTFSGVLTNTTGVGFAALNVTKIKREFYRGSLRRKYIWRSDDDHQRRHPGRICQHAPAGNGVDEQRLVVPQWLQPRRRVDRRNHGQHGQHRIFHL